MKVIIDLQKKITVVQKKALLTLIDSVTEGIPIEDEEAQQGGDFSADEDEMLDRLMGKTPYVGTQANVSGDVVPLPNNTGVETAPNTAGVELDSAGLPWDARIHASTKTKKADGTWTQRRGVDKQDVAAIEAQLRNVMSLPQRNAPVQQPDWTQTPEAASDPYGFSAVKDIPQVISKVNELINSKIIDPKIVPVALAEVGLPDFFALGNRLDLVQDFLAALV